jgi:hypothetical protein
MDTFSLVANAKGSKTDSDNPFARCLKSSSLRKVCQFIIYTQSMSKMKNIWPPGTSCMFTVHEIGPEGSNVVVQQRIWKLYSNHIYAQNFESRMPAGAAAIWAAAQWAAQFGAVDRYQQGHQHPVEVHPSRLKNSYPGKQVSVTSFKCRI